MATRTPGTPVCQSREASRPDGSPSIDDALRPAKAATGTGTAARMLHGLALAATVALAAGISSGCSLFGRNPDGFEQGLSAIDSRDFPRAIEHLREYVRKNPTDAAGWFNLGVALQDNGQPVEALDAYSQAHRHNPRDGRALVNMASIHDAEGRHVQARSLLDRALEAETSRAYPAAALGWHLERFGSAEEAERAFQLAITREPKSGLARYRYGSFLAWTVARQDTTYPGAPDGFTTALARATLSPVRVQEGAHPGGSLPELAPESGSAAPTAKPSETDSPAIRALHRALEQYRLAIDAWPDDVVALLEGADVAYELGDFPLALRWYERGIELASPPPVSACCRAALTLLRLDRPERAVAYLWLARGADPSDGRVARLLGLLYGQLAELERARPEAASAE